MIKMSGCVDVTPIPVLNPKDHRLRKRSHSQLNDKGFASNISKEKRKCENYQHGSQEAVTEPVNHNQDNEKKVLQCEQNTHERADNVVICSERNETEGYRYAEKFRANGQSTDLLVCRGCDLFSDENLSGHGYKEMFLLVDSDILALLLHKKSLAPSIDTFFEEFSEAGNHVHLINKMVDRHKFMVLFYQLPEGCAKLYKEVIVSQDVMDESSCDEEDIFANEAACVNNSIDSKDTGRKENFDINCNVPISDSVTDGAEQLQGSISHNNEALQDTITGSKEPAGDSATPQTDVVCDQQGQEHISPTTDKISECSNCKMTISAGMKQMIIAKQDGGENIMDIKIVPSASSSKMVVVLTSDPHDLKLEELLVTELNSKTDLVNISLKSHDSTIVAVRRGSVVMEIEVKEGREMSHDWIRQVLQLILQDTLTPDVLGGIQFDVSIDILNIIPKEQLEQYVLLRDPEKKHQTCVDKFKYDALVEELKTTKEKLRLTGGETINIINPKLSSGGSLLFFLSAATPELYLHS